MIATKKKGRAKDVDAYVGKRIREIRNLLGFSQEHLGKKCGIAFQQIGKYEAGENRVSCSRLVDIAAVLGVPVQKFFPPEATGENQLDILNVLTSSLIADLEGMRESIGEILKKVKE